MTNETREALVLLKAQLSASEEAALRFVLLRDALSRSASGGGIAEPAAAAERSLSAVRALTERVLRAVAVRQEELQMLVRSCAELLQKSADFVSYQLNVASGTIADDTYGRSQPVAGPAPGVNRAVAMFDADV